MGVASGCSMASVNENRFLPGPAWSVEREGAPRLKKPTVGSHPTQTRSVTMNYSNALWKLDRTFHRFINKKPTLRVFLWWPRFLKVGGTWRSGQDISFSSDPPG